LIFFHLQSIWQIKKYYLRGKSHILLLKKMVYLSIPLDKESPPSLEEEESAWLTPLSPLAVSPDGNDIDDDEGVEMARFSSATRDAKAGACSRRGSSNWRHLTASFILATAAAKPAAIWPLATAKAKAAGAISSRSLPRHFV
jgi:hypothetical protein